jgi:predicted transposase YdaD
VYATASTMTTTPHDALVKVIFSQLEHAAGILRLVLPPPLAARIDFSTLALCPGSVVDRQLRGRHTDLLFSAKLAGQQVLIYLLFEHQSTVEALMALRLLQYMVRIWERHHRAHPEARRLPPIIPVVLHHGTSGWSASTTFEGLLEVDPPTLCALGEHTVRMRFVLDDISAATDETLKGRAMTALGRVALWCLRHGREPDELMKRLRGWRDLVAEVRRAPNGREALEVIWRYILAAHQRKQNYKPEDVMGRLMEAAGEEATEELMSVADMLREEGRKEGEQKGRKEGEQKGERKILIKQLRLRFGDLSDAVVARIRAAGPRQIERWAERVLTARSLDEVLGKP